MRSVERIEAEFWAAFHDGLTVYEARPWEVPEQWRERCRELYDARLEALERERDEAPRARPAGAR